jgi:hypothetical protein
VAAIRSGQSTPLDDARMPTLDLHRLSASAAAGLLDRKIGRASCRERV